MCSIRTILVIFALMTAAPAVEAGQETEPHRLRDLAFMAGCWEGPAGDSGARVRESHFLVGGMMLGTGQTFTDGETAFFEFFRIEQRDAGIVYIPYPGGRESVPFRLVVLDGTRAVFENPEHDFPQRIVYHLRDDGGLVARIEGEVDGVLRFEEFPMRPVECGGPRP